MASGTSSANRSSRALRRDADIFAATREALAERGYEGVTMQALADRAGVVKKTLYNRYGNKDGLLLAAISEVVEGYRGVSGQSEPGIPSIITSRIDALRQIVATPAYTDAMTKAVVQAGSGHRLVEVLLEDGVAFHVHHLGIAMNAGELVPDADVRGIAEQAVGQAWGCTLLCMKGVIAVREIQAKSLSGLLRILIDVTRGARQRELKALLAQQGTFQGGTTS